MSQETIRPAMEPSPFRVISAPDSLIREHTLRAAHVTQPDFRHPDRRSLQRIPYARLLPLTPVIDDRLLPCGDVIYVIGKHLSPQGLDFFHHEPIPQRYAVASLENGAEQWLHFLLKITWCRFLKAKWYDSGGQFVRIIERLDERFAAPLGAPLDSAGGTLFCCSTGGK